jgi:hypothetical protein
MIICMVRFHQWLGNLLNAVGAPGFLRDTEFRSRTYGTHVRVKRGQLFTVVSVNGLDVYFGRFSGTVDGVGFSPSSACSSAPAFQSSQSTYSPAMLAQLDSALARSQLQAGPGA